MSTITAPGSKLPLMAGAAAAVLAAGIGGFALSRASHREKDAAAPAAAAPAVETAEPDGTGTVGDLQITQEAMELAEIRVTTAALRSVAEKLPVSGAIEPGGDRVAEITPRVAGRVVWLGGVVGDAVRAGQVLARIESTELAQAQSTYQQTSSRVATAENGLDRQRKLARLGVFGQPGVQEARKEVAAAQGEVNTTENELAAARNEVNEARGEKAALEGEVAAAESAAASVQGEASSANSQIAEAEGHVRAVRAALSQAQSRVKVAESRFNRVDLLLKDELVSKQDWEQAQADVEQARADVDAARANVAQAEAKVESAKAHREAARSRVEAARAKVRAERGRAEQAAAKIETAQARQAQVESRLEAAKQRAVIARQALAREDAVYRGGFSASKEIVEAEAALRQARIDRQGAERQVRLLGGAPGGGSAVALASPISGRVQERKASLGQSVDAAQALFKVMNLDLVWAQLAVTPRDLPLVRSGQEVVLTSEAAPGRTFTGMVSAVGSAADETTRAVRVRVALVNRDGALRPETLVRGSVITDVRRQRVTVPLEAVQEHNGRPTVYVALEKPGEFEVRHVKLGVSGEGWREIASDLEKGERIATGGTFYLKSEALKSSLSDGCCAPATGE